MKGTIHQEEISILNIYALNTGYQSTLQKTLMALRAHIDPNTVRVEDLNTPLHQ
jgi:hypothetical protein